MYAPHVVTVINATEENDTMQYRATVLHGVMLQAAKRTNADKSGAVDADTVKLFIPFNVRAVSVSGAVKHFASPKVYEAAEDKESLWTLQSAGKSSVSACFFVRGILSSGMSYTEALKSYDDVFRVSAVKTCDYGSSSMQHWEVGGI